MPSINAVRLAPPDVAVAVHQPYMDDTTTSQPPLRPFDRGLWVLLSRTWSDWEKSLVPVKPDTVIRWHRKGFQLYWRWKSRGPGRPSVSLEIRDLIRKISRASPLWGALVRPPNLIH